MYNPVETIDFYLIIPCYNHAEGLVRSIRSVHYHPSRFSILIIDDGSDVPVSLKSLRRYVPPELSIELIRIPVNRGITHALNTGLEWLDRKKGFEFVARLDCGDICNESRFYEQVTFLQQHPEIDLLGSWCEFKHLATGNSYLYKTPTRHKKMVQQMYFRNIFIHPTVMWRAPVKHTRRAYPETFPYAEDYGFFYEFLNKGKCAIIPKNLVSCEISNGGISLQHRKQQLESRLKIIQHYGRNKLLILLGTIKLWMLMAVPYPVILKAKKSFYGK